MNIFKDIKTAVSCKDAAIFYGLKLNRNSFTRCPFHPDRNPSMKFDNRYHCFGCGADGDVIDFVSKYFGLPTIEAVYKLCNDFNIDSDDDPRKKCGHQEDYFEKKRQFDERQNQVFMKKEFEDNLNFIRDVLNDFHCYWWNIRVNEAPEDINDELSDRFCMAIENTNTAQYYLDILDNGTENEKKELINKLMKEGNK